MRLKESKRSIFKNKNWCKIRGKIMMMKGIDWGSRVEFFNLKKSFFYDE